MYLRRWPILLLIVLTALTGDVAAERGKYLELLLAIEDGDVARVRKALDAGAPLTPKDDEVSLLDLAVQSGNVEIATALLDAGAKVDQPTWRGGHHTSLLTAAMAGNLDMVRLLLSRGAAVNHQVEDDVGTALRAVAGHGVEQGSAAAMAALLIENGADVNLGLEKEPEWESCKPSPLHAAVFKIDIDVVKLLVQHGADTEAKDASGRTSLECARHRLTSFRGSASDTANLGKIIELLEGWPTVEAVRQEITAYAPPEGVALGPPPEVKLLETAEKGKIASRPSASPAASGSRTAPAGDLSAAEDIVGKVERWRAFPGTAVGMASENPDEEAVRQTHADLGRLIEEEPANARARLLWVRLRLADPALRFEAGSDPEALPPGDDEPRFEAELKALEEALSIEPANAEGHYLKGRLLGPGIDHPAPAPDLERATAAYARSIELAPAEGRYREAYAICLAEMGRFGEARAQIEATAGPDETVAHLLADLESLPIPPGAVLDRRGIVAQALSMSSSVELATSEIADHWPLRIRTYRVAMTPEEVQSFYEKKWSGFRFLQPDSGEETEAAGRDHPEGELLAQRLHGEDGRLSPAASAAEFQRSSHLGVEMLLVPPIDETEPGVTSRGPYFLVLTNFNR